MFRAALRSLLQHRLRLALTVVAIVAGVSFVCGTYIFTDSLRKAFDALFEVPSPDLTVSASSQVGDPDRGDSGAIATLSKDLIGKVAAVPGVRVAYGGVRDSATIVIGSDGKPLGSPGQPSIGVAWVPDPALSAVSVSAGRAPTGPREVALLASTAERAGVAIGGEVGIDSSTGSNRYQVVGIVERSIAASDGGTLAVFDLPTASRVLLGDGQQITSVLAAADPGVSQDDLSARVRPVVPTDAELRTGAQRSADLATRLQDAFTFINTFLLAFAMIALFVSTFLIYNTFSMLVLARTRELALLRAVGATRGQVRRSVVAEAAVVGLLSSLLGLGAGIGVAQALRLLFDSFGATLPPGPLVVEPRTVLVALVAGLLVTVVSSYLPARRAAIIPPVAAMRDEVRLPSRSLSARTIIGVALVVASVIAARAGLTTVEDSERAASLVGLSALCGLVAMIAVAPVAGKSVVGVLGAPFTRSPVGRLARENGRRNPRRTAATGGALAIGLALMTAVGVIAASAKASVNEVVDNTIGADFIIVGAKFQPFTPEVYRAIQDTPGAAVVSYVRTIPAKVGDERDLVTGVQTDRFSSVFDITMVSGSIKDLSLGGAVIDSTAAKTLGVQVGDKVPVTFVNGPGTLRIEGEYTPSGFARGFIVSIPTLQSAGSLERDAAIYVRADEATPPEVLRDALTNRLAAFPSVRLTDQSDLKDEVNSAFDRVFGFVYALLALAIVVAFLGIINTLALSVHERRREVGMLRAVGTSRPQIRRMVVLESVLIAAFGALLGVALGITFGSLLQRSLADEGITVLAIPTGQLTLFVIGSLVGGFLAALGPAITASRLNMLRAIAAE